MYSSMGVKSIGGLNGVTVVASNNYIIGRVGAYHSNR